MVLAPDEAGKLTDVHTGEKVGLAKLYWARLPIKHSWMAVLFGPMKKGYLSHTALFTLLFCMVFNYSLLSFIHSQLL